jgi:XRE family aerobic/anaerobic benzoate catabolism transcriptional regulator
MSQLLQNVGSRLRARRHAVGLTLRALAQASGLSERYVGLAEKGEANLSLEKLHQLADALDVPVSWLVSDGPRGALDARLCALEPRALSEVGAWLEARHGTEPAPRSGIVALLGVRGAGKTAVGRRLAMRLGCPFVELDQRIEALADLSLAEIFAVHGEDYYRRVETEALGQLIESGGPAVVATGGSLVTHGENYDRLRAQAITVWLRARPEDHWNRVIEQGDRRPMRDHPHAMAELRSLLAARAPLYAQADHAVDTADLAVETVVDTVHRLIGPEPPEVVEDAASPG